MHLVEQPVDGHEDGAATAVRPATPAGQAARRAPGGLTGVAQAGVDLPAKLAPAEGHRHLADHAGLAYLLREALLGPGELGAALRHGLAHQIGNRAHELWH